MYFLELRFWNPSHEIIISKKSFRNCKLAWSMNHEQKNQSAVMAFNVLVIYHLTNLHMYLIAYRRRSYSNLIFSSIVQVNLCQKLFFLHFRMLYTKIVLNVRNNLCTQHVLPRFELKIFMYWTCNSMNNLSSYCG